MKTALVLINVISFSALLAVYAVPTGEHHISGVRRLLQTYSGQLPTGTFPTRKPVWELGVKWSDVA